MPLLRSAQIAWSEPWFFLVRIREAWGWQRRIFLAIGVAVLIFLAMHITQAGQRSLVEEIGVGLAAGAAILLLMDAGNVQREVTVYDDSIVVSSAIGRNWFTTIKFENVKSVQLLRPEDWEKPYGGMILNIVGEGFLVAVPRKISLDTLANILHRLGLQVELADWGPSEDDTRLQVRDEVEIDPARVRGNMTIAAIEAGEGRLLTPADITIQVLIAFGVLLVSLVASIWIGISLYQNRMELSWLSIGLGVGAAVVLLILGFMYLILIGQFAAAAYGVRVARRKLPRRANSFFTGMEDDLVVVELFERESWTRVVANSIDYGFLQVDRVRRELRFEGNKNRWTIPFSALKSCRIEESIVGSEGNPNPEKRYYVVISAEQDGKEWEAGMIYTRTELGSDTPEKRYARARLLFTQLAEAV